MRGTIKKKRWFWRRGSARAYGIWFISIFSLAFACTEVDPGYGVSPAPPLLIERESSIVEVEGGEPLSLPFLDHPVEQPSQDFKGVRFKSGGDVVLLELKGAQSPLLFALYGPRRENGTWGEARAHTHGDGEVLRLDPEALDEGEYLFLVGASEDGQVSALELSGQCLGECKEVVEGCPPLECSLVCTLGYALGPDGCEICACQYECEDDFDCGDGWLCREQVCVEECQCSEPYSPVCGRDRETYANACEASCAGTEVVHSGECAEGCLELSCETSCAYGYRLDDVGCPTCECIGACEVCGTEWAPVCTSNEETLLNPCLAECQGEVVAYLGPCRSMCPALDCDSTCLGRSVLDDLGCPTCSCVEGSPCEEEGRVCGADGVTYPSRCDAELEGVSVVRMGSCATHTCLRDGDCPSGTFCITSPAWEGCVRDLESGECGGLCVRAQSCSVEMDDCPPGYTCLGGVCQSSCLCSDVVQPVCGEDGATYDNSCVLSCAGVSPASVGACCPSLEGCSLDCRLTNEGGCPLCVCDESACICSDTENEVCVMSHDGVLVERASACVAGCAGEPVFGEGPCPIEE